jgi:hypothetical protein
MAMVVINLLVLLLVLFMNFIEFVIFYPRAMLLLLIRFR